MVSITIYCCKDISYWFISDLNRLILIGTTPVVPLISTLGLPNQSQEFSGMNCTDVCTYERLYY
jgi:hypothetical protein